MDNLTYMGLLVLVVALAFTFYRNNNVKLMLLVLAIGAYIIYSHETGHTATEYKDSLINKIDTSAKKFVNKSDTDVNATK
jgi:hypothetical protein